jgi:2-amino-4-hydroxy-6-hydroxymethyldihydropteridine diphosphokinase
MTSSGSRTGTAGAERGGRTVWLGLGTNLGDRAQNLARALAGLRAHIAVEAVSAIYATDPYGYTEQPEFWNAAVKGLTDLRPDELLAALQQVERDVGRTPTFRMGPRIMDIDILLYDDVVMDVPGLTLPHPGILQRAFVLLPLLDIEPDLRHPVTGGPLGAVAAAVDTGGVRRLGSAADLLPPSGSGA